MTVAKQITRPTPYASSDDFGQVFHADMNALYQLAFLLTADHEKAEQCFVSGLDEAIKGNPVFKGWARSWARRMVSLNAVRVINPQPADGNDRGRSSSDPADSNGKALSDGGETEIAAILELKPFERFAYVITVLERCSDQECSVLLGCSRRDVLAARVRALQQLASKAATRYVRHPTASEENPASGERRNSSLQLLTTPRLAAYS
jgi:hypothetical protein